MTDPATVAYQGEPGAYSEEGALALFRSAAAEELIHERGDALARMRQAGLTVLDVAPSKMAVAVVNRYLEVKARGAL